MAIAHETPRPPHPVAFDVEYPDELSRGLIFIKWLLAIPQLIVVYLLFLVIEILSVAAWFAVLITGRYPRSFFEFTSGALRWQANVFAYVFLLSDEYPPFSLEAGEYALLLTIPPADRQSRLRLFVRFFAIIPNQIALYVVTTAAIFTTFVAWWAILITGRYPRGLFKFAVGVMRWYERMSAYLFLLRDEYPPYSISADARPGNEVVSAIIGVPLFAAYIAVSLLPFFGLVTGNGATVHLQHEALATRSGLGVAHASAEGGNLRLTLLEYDDAAAVPPGADVVMQPGRRLVGFRVSAEKSGFWPAFFTPYLFSLRDCHGDAFSVDSPATTADSTPFRLFWRGGREEGEVYFQIPRGEDVCELRYLGGSRAIHFIFD